MLHLSTHTEIAICETYYTYKIIYIHIYMYIYTSVCIYTPIYVYIYIHVKICTQTHLFIDLQVYYRDISIDKATSNTAYLYMQVHTRCTT